MNKEDADQELDNIRTRLRELEVKRQEIAMEEHELCARRHNLMFMFYPDVINDQINKLLQLRRFRRG